MKNPILTYDSGFGGLSVLRHVLHAFPQADHLYVADDLVFPIGEWQDAPLIDHCVATIGALIALHDPRLVVIACNTASTLILPPLRAAFDLPFVGTVPAIKPAASETETGMVSVLATPGTVRRDYTRALMQDFASHCNVTLVGACGLAVLAEAYLRDGRVDEAAVAAEIAPCFETRGDSRTDVIVLACTHYPLLLPVLKAVAPWPVKWIDPAPAIARRVQSLLPHLEGGTGQRRFIMTSGAEFPAKAAQIVAIPALADPGLG